MMQFACIRNCFICPFHCQNRPRVVSRVPVSQPSLEVVIEQNVARAVENLATEEAGGVSSERITEEKAVETALDLVSVASTEIDPGIISEDNLPALQEVQYEILADEKKSIFPWRRK